MPLIAAGMDAKEHLAFCSTRGAGDPYALNDVMLYDDQIQLLRAAGVSVVPTIVYMSLGVAVSENPKMLDADTDVAPFISKDDFASMHGTDKTDRARLDRAARDARVTLAKIVRAGVTVGTGTDVWQLPTAVHLELEEFVASGLTPAEAIRAATSSAARIIGVSNDLGSVEPGKWADLVIVDADPCRHPQHAPNFGGAAGRSSCGSGGDPRSFESHGTPSPEQHRATGYSAPGAASVIGQTMTSSPHHGGAEPCFAPLHFGSAASLHRTPASRH
jgi:hypothetical protein